ncbi:MAG: PD40 domain-containing protein, partial [Candidatus Latescibacterota bacterium]
LGVFGVLALLRRRPPKRLLVILVSFASLYLVNTVVLSSTLGRFVLVPKSEFFGTSATTWKGREEWIDFTGRDVVEEELDAEGARRYVFADYIIRIPGEVVLLGRHVMPVVFLLALFGVFRRRLFLLAALLPFVFYPIFTVRSDPRYILPYVPPLVLYAAVGLEAMTSQRARRVLVTLLCLSTALGLFVNREQLTKPVSQGFRWAREAGLYFKDQIRPGEKVADRKPFLAFYAEAEYIEIPVAPYDEALDHLIANDVRLLSLHRATIHALRPALRPLLYDKAVIAGELRFNQAYHRPGVALIYERSGGSDPLRRERTSPPSDDVVISPGWSPDGKMIAYRVIDPSGGGGISVIPPVGGAPQRVINEQGTQDPLSWAPDSKQITFANSSTGNMDIFTFDIFTGTLEQVTSDGSADTSPSWSGDGREIVFCSDRSGQTDIWVKNLTTGQLTQVTTDGANLYPAIAPGGRRIAWIRRGEGVVIYDRLTGKRIVVESPRQVSFPPAWSPDGRFIAVTAEDWGGADICLMTADGANMLVLAKSSEGEGMPCWSPDGEKMVIVSSREGVYSLWTLTGLSAYTKRLLNPVSIRTFPRPD